MISQLKKAATATAVSVALAAPLSMAGMMLTADAAFAKSSGNKGGQSASRNTRGRIASTLKNLNAANAFKNGNVPAAVEQSPNSNIGQIGSLQLAVADTVAAAAAMDEADAKMAVFLAAVSAEYDEEGNLVSYDEDMYDAYIASLVDGEGNALYPDGIEYDDFMAELALAQEEAEAAYLTAVSMEEEALMTASGGNDFDYYGGYESETLVFLRGLLGY